MQHDTTKFFKLKNEKHIFLGFLEPYLFFGTFSNPPFLEMGRQVFLDPVYGLVVGMVVALLRDAAETARAESRVTLDKAIPHVAWIKLLGWPKNDGKLAELR